MSTEHMKEAREIIFLFGESVGRRRGWKMQAAAIIGTAPSVISRMLALSINVGPGLLTRVRGLKAFYGCDANAKPEPDRAPQSELVAMRAIDVALSSLDERTMKRVLDWTNAKFGGAR